MSEALDYNEEDFNRDPKTQAMGFVGGHSEMTWLLRLKQMLERPGPTTNPEEHSVASVYFFRDDFEIPILDNVDLAQRPTSTVADQLPGCPSTLPYSRQVDIHEAVRVFLLCYFCATRKKVVGNTKFGICYLRQVLASGTDAD